jgi:hypothetical protein
LLAVIAASFAFGACFAQTGDEAQIHSLARRSVEAIGRGDSGALYRMTDLDFRAVCTRERFAAAVSARWQAARPRGLISVEDVTIRHIRAGATLTVDTPGGVTRIRQSYVRDAGRWYIYEDESAC